MGTPREQKPRRRSTWTTMAVGGVLCLVGCQAEYAGMTLPSGKYLHDDIQYFEPGPHFPWANTQAATQRQRMANMGIEPDAAPTPPPANVPPPIPGNIGPGAAAPGGMVPPPPAPGGGAAPGGVVPPPPAPGGGEPTP